MRSLRCLIGCGALAALLGLAMAASRPASLPAEPSVSEIAALYKVYRQKQRDANELLRAAHAALDRSEYDSAIGTHKKARQVQAEATGARQRFEEALRKVVSSRIRDLDDHSLQVRERATAQLLRVGPWAASVLSEAIPGKSEEVQERLKVIVATLRESSEDEDGRLHQWACDATASSQYSDPDWGAKQATGKPDTMQGGDIRTAWAPATQDGGAEWLELTYETPVRPMQVRIRETYNPGAVVKVEAKDAKGEWHTLWEGKDGTKECPGWLEIAVTKPAWTCRVIKVHLDTSAVAGWNEIDAVELVGEPGD